MKFITQILALIFLLNTNLVQAGVIIGGTRLIYDGGKKESSLSVNNPDKIPYLIQTWVDIDGDSNEKIPFVVTPPLFRLDSEQTNVLRVVLTGKNIPADRESLYWMNIKSIPSSESQEDENTLQLAIKTRIKLIYRPKGLQGTPDEVATKLTWKRNGNVLQVSNTTPFYMNFHEITVAGQKIKSVSYVAPMSTASFDLPAASSGSKLTWTIINDYGGLGELHSSSL